MTNLLFFSKVNPQQLLDFLIEALRGGGNLPVIQSHASTTLTVDGGGPLIAAGGSNGAGISQMKQEVKSPLVVALSQQLAGRTAPELASVGKVQSEQSEFLVIITSNS